MSPPFESSECSGFMGNCGNPRSIPTISSGGAKARIVCDESNKLYADHVNENVPIFSDVFTFSESSALGLPAADPSSASSANAAREADEVPQPARRANAAREREAEAASQPPEVEAAPPAAPPIAAGEVAA